MTVLEYISSGVEEGLYAGADMAAAGVAGVILVVYFLVMLMSLAFSVAVYVLHSLGLYTIAQRRGIRKPWLAWVPIGNSWLLGSISDQYQYLVKGKVTTRRKMMLGLSITLFAVYIVWIIVMIVGIIVSELGGGEAAGAILTVFIGLFGMVAAAIALTVYQYLSYYDLYRSCERTNGVLYLILSILFSGIIPLLVFVCRKKDEGMPPRKQPTPQPVQVEPEVPQPVQTEPEVPQPVQTVPEAVCEPVQEEPQAVEKNEEIEATEGEVQDE